MARAGLTSALVALVFFPHASLAATLGEERESLVRRDTTNRVELDSHGAMLDSLSPKLSPQDKLTGDQYCDTDYPLGKDATSNCTNANPTDDEKLMDKEGTDSMCLQAASESGAKAIVGKFVLKPGHWQKVRPKGCFKQPCKESETGVCYFFNPTNDWPDHTVEGFSGTPVCKRPKTVNGTKGVAGSCPVGYQMIDDEETCRSVANCRGYPQAAEFRIGTYNASKHLDYVRGCFFDEDDAHRVYFNRKINPAMGECKNCKGTQLCMVTSTINWRGSDRSKADTFVPVVPHDPDETEGERKADKSGKKAAAKEDDGAKEDAGTEEDAGTTDDAGDKDDAEDTTEAS